MTIFEYLSVLVSIVLALGIAHLLSGLSSVTRAWRRVTSYWVFLLWTLWLLVIHVQIWWAYWDLTGETEWNFGAFAGVLVLPGLAYLMARFIIPETVPEDGLDLRAHFYSIRLPFFVALTVFWLWAMSFRTLGFGDPFFVPRRSGQFALALLAIAGASVKQERWHGWLAAVMLVVWIAHVWLFRFVLGAGIE